MSDMVDPHGRNPKDRPAVVVTPSEEIENEAPVFVVAITTTLPDPLPADYIRIPWSRPRHPRTGLNERNAAACHWLASVERSRVVRKIGRVPSTELSWIEEALRDLANDAP